MYNCTKIILFYNMFYFIIYKVLILAVYKIRYEITKSERNIFLFIIHLKCLFINIQMVLNVKSGINLYKKKKIKVINGFMIATKNSKYFVFVFFFHLRILSCAFLQEVVSKAVFESGRLIIIHKP